MVVTRYLHKLNTECVLSHYNKVHKAQVSEKYVQTTSLRGRKRSTIAYTNNRLQRFLVPSVQSSFMLACEAGSGNFMAKHVRHMMCQLNSGIEYLGLGKVMWYQQKVRGTSVRG
jgi:hypothetical protein